MNLLSSLGNKILAQEFVLEQMEKLRWKSKKTGGYILSGLREEWPESILIRSSDLDAGSWRLTGVINTSFEARLSDTEAKSASMKMIQIWAKVWKAKETK